MLELRYFFIIIDSLSFLFFVYAFWKQYFTLKVSKNGLRNFRKALLLLLQNNILLAFIMIILDINLFFFKKLMLSDHISDNWLILFKILFFISGFVTVLLHTGYDFKFFSLREWKKFFLE